MEKPSSFSSRTKDRFSPVFFTVLSIHESISVSLYALSRLSTGMVCSTSGKSEVRSLPTLCVGESGVRISGCSFSSARSSSKSLSYSRSETSGLPVT